MASTAISPSPFTFLRRTTTTISNTISPRQVSLTKTVPNPSRRQILSISTTSLIATLSATVLLSNANAQDIGLFGIRKKIEKVEEEAKEIIIQGFESAEKGIESAEKGIETAEKEIVTVEEDIEAAVRSSAIAQAVALAGAEAVAVLVATSVVNSIIGPEPQN